MLKYIRQASNNKLIGVSLLLVFSSVLFFSFFHMSYAANMSSEMPGCPFMSAGEVVCSMDLEEHIASWEALSLAAPTVLLFVFLISLLCALYISYASLFANLFKQLRGIWEISTPVGIKRGAYIPIPNYLEVAFSSGILHPKLF